MISPTLTIALRELAQQAKRDPDGAYDALSELTQALLAPSSDPYAQPARVLGLAISRAREDYAQRCDELADEPELPLARAG